MKQKKWKKNLLAAGMFAVAFFIFSGSLVWYETNYDTSKGQASNDYAARPDLYLYGGESTFSRGGLVELSSTEEPSINVRAYHISGNAKIDIYKAGKEDILNYLIHDGENNQLQKETNFEKFEYVTSVDQKIDSDVDEDIKVTLPLEESGIWFARIVMEDYTSGVFILRSKTGVLVKEGNNELVFWAQDFATKRSITQGKLTIYNLLDKKSVLSETSFYPEGIAKVKTRSQADIALFEKESDVAVVPINLKYMNSSYRYENFIPKTRETKYFTFTDRPLYQPGDTVYFKSVLRDDDDARYTIPKGSARVEVSRGWGDDKEMVFEKEYEISSDGTVFGEFKLPEDASVGGYNVKVGIPDPEKQEESYWDYNYTMFQVEYYRKPEYSIEVESVSDNLIAGDELSFDIKGSYFSGFPLSNKEVSYTVYSSDFYEYSRFSDQLSEEEEAGKYRYRYWYGSKEIQKGTAALNDSGEAHVSFTTFVPGVQKTKSQIFSVEVEFKDESGIPVLARKNVLVRPGEFGIYLKDNRYGGKAEETIDIPIILDPYRESRIADISLNASVKRTEWVKVEDGTKYGRYEKKESNEEELRAVTNDQGEATLHFTPRSTGSYTLTVEASDNRGNTVSKEFYYWISDRLGYYYSEDEGQGIKVQLDKEEYELSDTAKITLSSVIPDRDVLLSFERGEMHRFQVVRLQGSSGAVDVSFVDTDIPNIFAHASSFSDVDLDESQANILLSTRNKELRITITPDQPKYGPGDTVAVDILTSDASGNPVSSDVAFWAMDKALLELTDAQSTDILSAFWSTRYNDTEKSHSLAGIMVNLAEQGGCFAKGTKVLMINGEKKNIEDIKAGDRILTRKSEEDETLVEATVSKVHAARTDGYLILNGTLRVTPNHIMRVDNEWKEAGSVQTGDIMESFEGKKVSVYSVEWQRGIKEVYNLEIETYHTYFADGLWVHNNKDGVDRSVFKDSAYWNPRITTDHNGQAKVTFTLPDNLTTWVMNAVGSTRDTKVGDAMKEISVQKDIVVRPILPNILREGDTIVLSALVHNFTETENSFKVNLEFDSGEVVAQQNSEISIKPKKFTQLYWTVIPKRVNDNAVLKFSAISTGNDQIGDAVTKEIPVEEFGFHEYQSFAGEGERSYRVAFSPAAHVEKSDAEISIAGSILGSLPSAMKYLIDYPYGCVEQTTSRLVPALSAKKYPDLFRDALEGKDVDEMIRTGLKRLSLLQNDDGGWSWWGSGSSDPFVTAYVTEYLVMAKESGFEVKEELFSGIKEFLKGGQYDNTSRRSLKSFNKEAVIAKAYALTLIGDAEGKKELKDFENISPDLLSLAIIANHKNGWERARDKGIEKLISLGEQQGNWMSWKSGKEFGSEDASTALAIRAFLVTGTHKDATVKAVDYLARHRKSSYWSNTFGTAQVMRAITEFSLVNDEANPHYTFTIKKDSETIHQGEIKDYRDHYTVNIPAGDIKKEGSDISIEKSGEGNIYSTILTSEFITDRNATGKNQGLQVSRKYISEKGPGFTSAVGETVMVQLTVTGSTQNEEYVVIDDKLPSGMVPVNTALNNEQSEENEEARWYSPHQEATRSGMVLSLRKINPQKSVYTYRARVISEGDFTVPPARASLMYSPAVYGLSEVEKIHIGRESLFSGVKPVTEEPKKNFSGKSYLKITLLMVILAVSVLSGIIAARVYKVYKRTRL